MRVSKLLEVERYSHVMHLVSQVDGELRAGEDALSLLQATFPAGTVSGAPKVRAMQLISQIEGTRRGVYAGALGYVGFDGALDTCIALRTIVMRDGVALLQAGAGIVADSDPASEHVECMNKLAALSAAIDLAETGQVRPMTVIAPPGVAADAPRVLLVDNYDSFTYNLAHLLCEAGAVVDVRRHDAVTRRGGRRARADAPRRLPRPRPAQPRPASRPSLIERFAGRVPVLGVCLGHQCIVEVYGGVVERARRLMHGKVGHGRPHRAGRPAATACRSRFEAGRYHSLAAIEPLPEVLIATARDRDGEVMALRHRDIPHLHGVQFHPESVLTPAGDVIARNFLAMGSAA